MVRSLPSSYPTPPWHRIDAKRIAGSSLAICVHVVVLGALMFPHTWSPPAKPPRPETIPVLVEPLPPVDIPLTTPPPDPQPVTEVRRNEPRPVVETMPVPDIDSTPVFDQGEIEAPPVASTTSEPTDYNPGPPAVMTLAYDISPAPRYPRPSLIAGHEGTVTLRVLVDETGQPQEVTIDSSSGHRALDQAARTQVLQHWRFHPAQRQGRAVAAYALVPIVFSLP